MEPNLKFWDTMINVSISLQEYLAGHDIAVPKLGSLTMMCLTARDIASAQLKGETLTEDQQLWIRGFASRLEGLSACPGTLNLHVPKDQSIVESIVTDGGMTKSLYAGVSRPQAIYVILDGLQGDLTLARGGVLSYREFWRPLSEGRLDDEQWRRMLSQGKVPEAPKWMSDISAGKPISDKEIEERKKARLEKGTANIEEE